MKTIKVIDLLNKIANNEELPKKFIYVDEENIRYVFDIEEDKEIEELNLDADALKGDEIVRTIDYLLESKINSLVKAVNELKKGK